MNINLKHWLKSIFKHSSELTFLYHFFCGYTVGFLHSCIFTITFHNKTNSKSKMINKSLCKFHSHFTAHAPPYNFNLGGKLGKLTSIFQFPFSPPTGIFLLVELQSFPSSNRN